MASGLSQKRASKRRDIHRATQAIASAAVRASLASARGSTVRRASRTKKTGARKQQASLSRNLGRMVLRSQERHPTPHKHLQSPEEANSPASAKSAFRSWSWSCWISRSNHAE